MAGFPDVRLDGVSHGEILQWVRGGKGDSTTQALEAQLQQIVQLLHDSGEDVNKAVQRANAGDWQGSTAESAHGAMVTMRDYDDTMHGHSENTRYSAMGQSGESVATRSRVPEVASPQGGQVPQLVNATEDPHDQLAAKRSAEEQARQVMGEYRDATQARVNALPAIPPVPKVVLDTGGDASPAAPGGGSTGTRHGSDTPDVPGVGPTGSTGSYGSGGPGAGSPGVVPGGSHVSAPPVSQGTDPSSVGTLPPGSGSPGVVPPGSSGGGTAPVGPWGGVPGGSGYGVAGAPGRGGFGGAGGQGQGQGQGQAGRGGQAGARSAAGALAAEEGVARRGGVAGAGRGGAAGPGGMLGGGQGADGEEDAEHINKYGLPSDEHFDEDDEFLRDPRNRDFFVAPDVIGGPE